ncbi:MAG TPA: hypothetical protein VK452_03045 [Dissulfurispiraceae bacterium]|nr:hypothetical protein [Dissulfurispiraceae bacterium]
MKNKIAAVCILLLIAGCVQNISYRGLGSNYNVPSISYEAYYFSSGISDRSRAVLLKIPDSGVTVEPHSSEIIATTATYGQALYFMREKRGGRSITTQVVYCKDKPVGYLLRYNQPGFNMETVNVNLTEKDGVIFFSAREETQSND